MSTIIPLLITYGGIKLIHKGLVLHQVESKGIADTFIFFAFGGLVLVFGIYLFIHVLFFPKPSKTHQSQYPDHPWLWKDDWVSRRIQSTTHKNLFFFLMIGSVFTIIGIQMILNPEKVNLEGIARTLFLIVFPLIGLSLLLSGIYKSLRRLKFCQSHCQLLTLPGYIGEQFSAEVWFPIELSHNEPLTLSLRCYHRYEIDSGSDTITKRDIKWSTQIQLNRNQLQTNSQGLLGGTIHFPIPNDVKPSTPGEPDDRYEWALSAEAILPGIDLKDEFIVPIFHRHKQEEALIPEEVLSAPLPSISGVEYTEDRRALGLRIADRNWGSNIGMIIFCGIWTTLTTGFVIQEDAPIWFDMIFVLISLLLIYATLWLIFGVTNIRIQSGWVYLHSTILGIGKKKTFGAEDIKSIQVITKRPSSFKTHYNVELTTNSGQTTTIYQINNEEDAINLMNRMKLALR